VTNFFFGNERDCVSAAPVPRKSPIAIMLLVSLLALVVALPRWIPDPSLGWRDPDAMMRLVEVKDFLAGQAWFDLTQHRLGPSGASMHWSRPLDAILAGAMSLTALLLGNRLGELVFINLWGPLLLIPFAAILAAVASRASGQFAAVLTIAYLVCSPSLLFLFQPGALDHHNVQVLLIAVILLCLCRMESISAAVGIAAAAAASLAIGLEQLPLIALTAALVALRWVRLGSEAKRTSVAFGLSFAAITLALFAASISPAHWTNVACDAISIVYVSAILMGSLSFVAIALVMPNRASVVVRAIAVILSGASVATIWAFLFPVCLSGPFSQVDPRLFPLFLDHVAEAQNVLTFLKEDPATVVVCYIAPLLTLAGAATRLRSAPDHEREMLLNLMVLLSAAIAVALWQIRGVPTVQAIAAPLASIVVLGSRARVAPTAAVLHRLKPMLAGVAFAPIFWFLVSVPVMNSRDELSVEECRRSLAQSLAPLPSGMVASSWTSGSLILAATHHSALAAPYHRNTDGILVMADLWSGSPDHALETIKQYDVNYVASCPDDGAEEWAIAQAPEGFLARLRASPPSWLRPVPSNGTSRVFEIAPQ
jgi:hypothetical protein